MNSFCLKADTCTYPASALKSYISKERYLI